MQNGRHLAAIFAFPGFVSGLKQLHISVEPLLVFNQYMSIDSSG